MASRMPRPRNSEGKHIIRTLQRHGDASTSASVQEEADFKESVHRTATGVSPKLQGYHGPETGRGFFLCCAPKVQDPILKEAQSLAEGHLSAGPGPGTADNRLCPKPDLNVNRILNIPSQKHLDWYLAKQLVTIGQPSSQRQ